MKTSLRIDPKTQGFELIQPVAIGLNNATIILTSQRHILGERTLLLDIQDEN